MNQPMASAVQHGLAAAPRDSRELHCALKYLGVGSLGFLTDAGLLALQVHGLGMGPYAARIPSFLGAVTITWWLNRQHTFKGFTRYSAVSEYRRYFLVQSMGALANFAVYAAAIAGNASFAHYPVAALALGSIFGLAVNYAFARLYVFPGSRP